MDEENLVSSQEENVRVCVRVRPLNKKEKKLSVNNIVNVDSLNRTLSVQKPGTPTTDPPKTYTFDYVFDESASQMEIYSETTRGIVDSVIDGYNGTILGKYSRFS